MIRKAALIACLVLAPAAVVRAESGDAEPGEALPAVGAFPTPMAAPLVRILAALGAISATGATLAWWARRRRGTSLGGPNRIEVLATRSLGARHQVVLIEVGERRLLVGTAPESVRTLADLTELPPFRERIDDELPERDPELLRVIGRFEGLDG